MRTSMRTAVLVLTALLLVAATASAESLDDPIPEPIAAGSATVGLETVATGLTAPNWGASVPGCVALRDRLVVTDQDGILWAVDLPTGQKSVLLDVSDRLVSLGVAGPGSFDERGLLGVALHPNFADNGRIYTYTSEPVAGSADFSTMPTGVSPNHQSVVREWRIPEPCNAGSVVDPATSRELLRVDQPQFNHNAGALAFGPDGNLHVALGDGGGADDQGIGHVPGGNGQDPGNVLGAILRIDPDGSDAANGQYGIPADNPFVGDPGGLDEIFAFGFRNPFRLSFDARTGELYIADVGQNDIEEVDRGVAGGNYGWRAKEGSFCFDPNGSEAGFVFDCGPGDAPDGLTDPVAEYDHDEGIAVVGGFVYRGEAVASLRGRYVFGDFFHPASDSGRLFYLDRDETIRQLDLAGRDTLGASLLGFGQDAAGEQYVLVNETGTPFGDTGKILRITPVCELPPPPGAIVGSSRSDVIRPGFNSTGGPTPGAGNDVIFGLGGSDQLKGGGGHDIICGGPGSDELIGARGGDILVGNGGSDKLEGRRGHDRLAGGRRTDALYAGAGNDALSGGPASDYCDGGSGSGDTVDGTCEATRRVP